MHITQLRNATIARGALVAKHLEAVSHCPVTGAGLSS